MSTLEDRINELEIRYTHQACLVEDLDQVVVDLGERIYHLEQENGRLRQLLQRLAPELEESPDE